MTKAGPKTRELGEWLHEHCYTHDLDFNVYYDHGDKNEGKHVAASEIFYGQKVSHSTHLADVDIAVGTKDGIAKLMIEVEEHPPNPKKILGTFLTNMIGHGFHAAGRNYYVDENTSLILSFWFTNKGHGREKAEYLFNKVKEKGAFPEGILVKNIHLILESDLSRLIETTKEAVLEQLSL